MKSLSDQQLLAAYAERHAEAAFAELVRRHIDLVHSAAMRMVQDSRLAEDVAQNTFIALANNAAKLVDHPVLSGWLHRTAQNLSSNIVRSDVRRRAREHKAATMNELLSSSQDASWEQITPHLDAALGDLSDSDREVVLLRYFERKSAREMANILNVSASAAQKRVNRAMERMREFFARRGVAVNARGLDLISSNAVYAAPVGLAVTISTAATVTGTLASTATLTAIKAITMTTMQKTLITATVAVLAGAGIYEARQVSQLRDQVSSIQQQHAVLTEQTQRLEVERDDAINELAIIKEAKERMAGKLSELHRLRGMAGVARRATSEAERLRAQLDQQTSDIASNPMTGAMKQAMDRQVEGRLSRMTVSLRLTPEQNQSAREILLRQAQAMSAGMQQAYTGKYDKQEITSLAQKAGNTDEQLRALLTPEQQALFPELQVEEAAHNASLVANQELIGMYSTLGLNPEQMDLVYAALYQVSFDQQTNSGQQTFANEGDAMQWALERKTKALEPLLSETQLENYRQQQTLQAQLVRDILEKMENSGAPN